MPYHPKTGIQQFDSSWQSAVAWAHSQGIGPESYLPVYSLDLTRIQNGEYPMGRAERNLAIAAAHNPNAVTSSPSDHPASAYSPSGAFHNAVSDVGKIATGLAGIFTGSFEKQVWNSAKTTFHAITDPASMESKTGGFGGTIGNWLNNTLLAYLPGAADIGTVLQHDPTLTGSKGLYALAQHPIVSILDVMPGGAGMLERGASRLGMTAAAAKLAEHGGGVGEVAKMAGSIKTGKMGVPLSGGLPKNLTLADRIQLAAARGGKGVGPALSHLGAALQEESAMSLDLHSWLMDGPVAAAKNLTPEQIKFVQGLLDTHRTDGGDKVREFLDAPPTHPGDVVVKDFIKQWLNGPLRYAKEAEAFAGGILPRINDHGEIEWWTTSGVRARRTEKAYRASEVARKAAIANLTHLAPFLTRAEHLDAVLGQSKDEWTGAVGAARQTVFSDPKLALPLTRDLPKGSWLAKKGRISRAEQVHAVVGEGGIADQFFKAIESGDPDRIGVLATMMRERLSAWGVHSINAEELNNPALTKLYELSGAFEKWAKMRKAQQKEIDKAIYGEIGRQEHMLAEQNAVRAAALKQIKERHARERADLLERLRKTQAKNRSDAAARILQTRTGLAIQIEHFRSTGDRVARRATNEVLTGQIMPRVREQEREANRAAAATIKQAKHDLIAKNKEASLTYQRDSSRMVRRHNTELSKARKIIAGERIGMGGDLRAVRAYGAAIKAFHTSVFDNPSDAYRDVFVELLIKHVNDRERTAALTMATDKYLRSDPKRTEEAIAKMRSDPEVIYDFVRANLTRILNQPDLTPEVAAMAQAEWRAAREDAHEELKTLIGQGLRIEYIPTATSLDEKATRDSMAPLIGHGIPKPDMAKERVWDLTPHKDDFALGINKAVLESLQRDATIHYIDHTLMPLVTTKAQLEDYFHQPEQIAEMTGRKKGVNVPQFKVDTIIEQMGLMRFDPKAMFGFTHPRWGSGEDLYLPKSLVVALKKFEEGRKAGLLAKGNKVFRYSILGLSPRYTAHILFGGTMMLALRSSPEALLMLGKAHRAIRDGTLPEGVLRGHVAELGFESPIDIAHREMAKDAIHVAVGEHIETRQKVASAAATPLHALRALADLNFRFTNHVRNMQGAVAYLDAAAKATRRDGKVMVEDAETGRMVAVTPDRAVKEGVHHVQEVFGNLHAMSPFERQIAQSFMPFYGWQKHILGYVMSFPFDHPYRALILSQMALNASNQVPLAFPLRIQFLYFLGSPDKQGNVNAIDLRSLDPFRDVANYASLQGIFQSLNPAITALPSVANPEFSYGSSQLYPGVTYNQFYGIRTATGGGSWLNAVEQFVPQTAAVQSALQAAGGMRSEWKTNPTAATKALLSSLNIPFVNPPVNLKQIAAKDEAARFEVAKTAAANAFQTGDFSSIAGYTTVPNPLNSAYEITPAQLETLYKQALAANPGVAPIESLLPPPTPYGY